jgi:hypothetical protein
MVAGADPRLAGALFRVRLGILQRCNYCTHNGCASALRIHHQISGQGATPAIPGQSGEWIGAYSVIFALPPKSRPPGHLST